jgi:hypothetical protein
MKVGVIGGGGYVTVKKRVNGRGGGGCVKVKEMKNGLLGLIINA